MRRNADRIRFLNVAAVAAVFYVCLFAVLSVNAAPHNGEGVELSQPDGSVVTVFLYGDEFHAAAESRDGFTLVRDSTGWICYAELSADGSEYVSTGVRYTEKSRAPNARRNLRINERGVREKRERNREAVGDGEQEQGRGFRGRRGAGTRSDNLPAPEDTMYVVGFALFIAFPDYQAPNNDNFLRYADSAYNRKGFRGNGSVYDYYSDVSNGKMQYTNYISAWVTAPEPFSYYDSAPNYGRVQELITAALNELNKQPAIAQEIGRQVSTYQRSGKPTAYAMNIHPIRSGQSWANGIWSHRGWYRGGVSVGGVNFYDYQFSGLGNSGTVTSSSTVPMGTILHENGHMLFDWPDLYPYVSGQRNFVSGYCIMSSSSGSNPQMPNPYFRSLEGWIDVSDINNMSGTFTHVANSHTAYRYVRDTSESYFIEARKRTGRSSGLPGAGLLIWHIHTRGDNANYEVGHTNPVRRIPRVAVMQANNGTGSPTAQTPYAAGRNTEFHKTSAPPARYHTYGANGSPWSGDYSDLNIVEISAAADSMTFRIPSLYEQTGLVTLTVENGIGSGLYGVDSVVQIAANVPPDGYIFDCWTGDSLSLTTVSDVTEMETYVTVTGTDSITLTALFKQNLSVKLAAAAPLTFDIKVNPSGNVSFQIPKSERVSIRMYDVRGRMVTSLFDGVKNPGFYTANISAGRGAGFGSGLYIVRMKSGSFSKSVKVHFRK